VRSASVIPWGDLVTAHWQTGIPDISVYTARRTSKVADLVIPIVQQVMKIGAVRDFAKKKIEQRVEGPLLHGIRGRGRLLHAFTADGLGPCRATSGCDQAGAFKLIPPIRLSA